MAEGHHGKRTRKDREQKDETLPVRTTHREGGVNARKQTQRE